MKHQGSAFLEAQATGPLDSTAKACEVAQRQKPELTQLQYFARAAKTLDMLNERNRAWQEKIANKPICSTKPAEEPEPEPQPQPEDEDIVMDYSPETINSESSEDKDVVMEDYKPEPEVVTVSLTRDFEYMTCDDFYYSEMWFTTDLRFKRTSLNSVGVPKDGALSTHKSKTDNVGSVKSPLPIHTRRRGMMDILSEPPGYSEAQDDYNIQRLEQLCLPRWHERIHSTVIRPERPEFAEIFLKGKKANPNWTRAVELIYNAINCSSSEQTQELQEQELEQRRPETGNWKYKLASLFVKYGPPNESTVLPEPLFLTPLEFFLEDLDAFVYPDDIARPVLSAIALILYDQECSGQTPRTRSATTHLQQCSPLRSSQEQRELSNAFKHLLEHMFLIDYQLYEFGSHLPPSDQKYFRHTSTEGLIPDYLNPLARYITQFAGRIRNGQLPPLYEWRALAARLLPISTNSEFAPEIALILHNYHTHRTERVLYPRPDGKETDDPKLTGYTGILRELIADVPTKGPDRLLRKLSLDVQIFSHTHYVDDFRIRHLPHTPLRPNKNRTPAVGSTVPFIPMVAKLEINTPAFYKTHRDGYTIAEKKTSIPKKTWFSHLYYMGIPPMGPKRRGFVTFDTRLMNGNTTSPTVKEKRFGEMFEYTDEQLERKWRSAKEFARGWNDAHKKNAAESECGPGCSTRREEETKQSVNLPGYYPYAPRFMYSDRDGPYDYELRNPQSPPVF
ncbi:hypothetical protein QBC37DRAFT_392694 [Rhypophila decipiens]|uniref:Uncharacterized protein n=1 Tax=Rhypophila decipiens TaxID=261697 RepID=A0AAN7B1K9_9PEZI|nr:hypothetical protein QBC37DRAFT_392694 [Rhypophila decipiens]